MKKTAVLISMIAGLAFGQAHAAGDSAKGKRVFNKCKACHALVAGKKKIGPSLHGIYGRKAGTAPGYSASKAMKDSGVVWSPETLSRYLADPKKFIPGNKMPFPGLRNEEDLANLNAYLLQATK
jgi:cytochrome c2